MKLLSVVSYSYTNRSATDHERHLVIAAILCEMESSTMYNDPKYDLFKSVALPCMIGVLFWIFLCVVGNICALIVSLSEGITLFTNPYVAVFLVGAVLVYNVPVMDSVRWLMQDD